MPEISFARLMEYKEPDLTARYFLTILHLANNEDIVIVAPTNHIRHRLVRHDEFRLKLVDPMLRAEAIDESNNFNLYDQHRNG